MTLQSKNPRDGVAILSTGDVDALTYGGGLLYYQPYYSSLSWDFWYEPPEDVGLEIEDATYRVFRFSYGVDEDLFDGSLSWAKRDRRHLRWPRYNLESIASSMGMDADGLRELGSRDTDALTRWRAAQIVEGHWGAENLDSYPVELSHSDMVILYGKDLDKVSRRSFADAQKVYAAAKKRSGNPGTKQLKNKLMK